MTEQAASGPGADLPTGIGLTALDPAFRADPYPILARLRERDPIHRDQELGRVVFTRHADVFRILRDPDHWTDPRKANPGTFTYEFLGGKEGEEPSMLLMDEPGHKRLRELVRRSFTPRAVEAWRSRARGVAERVIDGIEGDTFDVIADLAGPIPTVVIAELLGIDAGMHSQFKRWSDDSITVAFSPVNDPDDVARAAAARDALCDFFAEEITRRRKKPGADLISQMLESQIGDDRLTDEEIISQCNLLLLAGNLTTTDLIGNGLLALTRHPDQQRTLRERPELMKNAVEEILRYDSPVTNSGRIAHMDMEIGGVKIAQGESLSVSLAAANRDPEVHPDPDRFDVERRDIQHLSFGGGRHFCLGAHLARLEAAETLAVALERFRHMEVGPGGFAHASNPSFRGLEHFSMAVRR